MRINPAPLRIAQTAIIGLSLALSIAILGTSANTLSIFNEVQSYNPWWMPLWPQHFNVDGTKAIIGSAAAVIVLSIIYLVFALVPVFQASQRHTFRALLALATALPSTLVTLVTIIYAHILNKNAPEFDTIQTWTCKYKDYAPLEVQLPVGMDNNDFDSICKQSRFALYGSLVVFLLMGIGMAAAIVTWLAEKWEARRVRKESEIDMQQS